MIKLESVNKDATGINDEKLEFFKFVDLYKSILPNIASTIFVLNELEKEDNLENISYVAPNFTQNLLNNYIYLAIIQLYAFYSNDDLSFRKFFNYIRANYNKIFTGDFYDYIKTKEGELIEEKHIKFDGDKIFGTIEECENIIAKKKDVIEDLGELRDNVCAHFSKDKNDKVKSTDVSIKLLDEMFNITEEIFNKIILMYDRTVYSLKPIGISDVSIILDLVKNFCKNKKEVFLKYQKNNEDKNER